MQLSPASQVQPWDSPSKSHCNLHLQREKPLTGRSRRQHRSCDQCRKGKRACDVTLVNYAASPEDASTSPMLRPSLTADPGLNWSLNGYSDSHGQPFPILTSTGPCSNCSKTAKSCTLEWLKSVHHVISQRCKPIIAEATGPKKKPGNRKRRTSATAHTSTIPAHIHTRSNSDTSTLHFPTCLSPDASYSFPGSQLSPDVLHSNDNSEFPNNETSGDYPFQSTNADSSLPWASTSDGGVNIDFMSFPSPDTQLQNDWDSSALLKRASDLPLEEELPDFPNQRHGQGENGAELTFFSESTTTTPLTSSYGTSQSRSFNRCTPSLSQMCFEGFIDPQLDHLQQQLTSSTNQTLLTNSLLRIYHDSMENALSCWLTEKTCPYGVDIPSPSTIKHSMAQESMTEEWGANWSNRIYARVCHLDRASSVVRGRSLTQSEEISASKAVHLAIMSFATQWAQSSSRSKARFSSFDTRDDGMLGEDAVSDQKDGSVPMSTEFDRCMQETLWYQARRALQDSAEIESFRVIFAHIIFSLTQRPLNVAQHVQNMKRRRRSSAAKHVDDGTWFRPSSETRYNHTCIPSDDSSRDDLSEAGILDLDEVTELEGPPIFLETALRQIFSYRCKLERLEKQRTVRMKKQCSPDMVMNPNILNAKDRKTFDLLFWLAIMFDTLSAAMNKRPLVVSDEDSDIRHQSPQNGNVYNPPEDTCSNRPRTYRSMLANESDSMLWGNFLLRQKHLRFSHSVARWPCSYEDAASTLCDAAPIKVLLFRKVTHLQTLLSRRIMYEKLEQTILDALQVYQHWNDSYNQFILDCIASHDHLPPRIQSWYVILAGHWHLAALLLADTIEDIDEGDMGLESQRKIRRLSRLVSRLREQNANMVADLGKASCPGYNLTFPQAREFHFAVSEGALLTEPWTVVLIRAFSKAGSILLQRLSHHHHHRSASAYENDHVAIESETVQTRQRCSFCIRALWNLGKKSDMAFLAATALSTALEHVPLLPKRHSPEIEAIRQCSFLSDETAAQDAFPFAFSAIPSYC